jgi:hypothetical protein
MHQRHLLGYLERNQDALVHYAARRMNKKQQMRWNRTTV